MPQREGSSQISRVSGCMSWREKLFVRPCYINFADNVKLFWLSLQSNFLDASLLWISDMNNFLISFIKIIHFVRNTAAWKNTSFLIFKSRKFQQNKASHIFKISRVYIWNTSPIVFDKYCCLFSVQQYRI